MNDPAHPQTEHIERLWKEFRPDVAFHEGGNPPTEADRDAAIRKYGEPGLVRFLAARDGVPVFSLEPSRRAEVTALLRKFSPEEIKVFYLLRSVIQPRARFGKHAIDGEVERIIPIFNTVPELRTGPNSVAELQSSFRRFFPDHDDFREVPATWLDPGNEETFLNHISRASSDIRDEFMVDLLAQQVRLRKRIFAVVGGSHVVMQEPALRGRLK